MSTRVERTINRDERWRWATTRIVCDEPDCAREGPVVCEDEAGPQPLWTIARLQAKDVGWTMHLVGSLIRDRCPAHSTPAGAQVEMFGAQAERAGGGR